MHLPSLAPYFPLSCTFTCRWRTLHGCSQGRQFSGEAQKLWPNVCWLWGHCVREVKIASLSRHAIQGHRAPSIQGQLPMNESSSSGPKPLCSPCQVSFFNTVFFFFYPLCLSLPPLSLPSSCCLCPNSPTLCPQPTCCLVIRELMPLGCLECACKAYRAKL